MNPSLNPRSQDHPPRTTQEARAELLELARITFLEYRDVLRAAGAVEHSTAAVPSELMSLGTLIVRREHPEHLIAAIRNGSPLEVTPIDSPTGTRYANCAVWRPPSLAGFDNALHEGMTHHNEVAAVFGFLEKPGMDIRHLEDSMDQFYGLERYNVRSFMGSLPVSEIRFVRLRVPLEALREEEMTEEEQDALDALLEKRLKGERAAAFAHRWFVFPKGTH